MSFNWNGNEIVTNGDIMDAICAITTPKEAQEFMSAYRAVNNYADSNVGYLTGYLSAEKAVQVRALFRVSHPIFG